MYQIATEGGFLPNWVELPNGIPIPLDPSDPTNNTADPTKPFNLLLAPAERADVLIDFTGFGGKNLILFNDAPGPFPGGDPRNDYYTGDPDFTNALNNSYGSSGGAPSTVAGFGPNTRTIMKIVVGSGSNGFLLTPTKLSDLSTALKQNFTGGNSVAPQQDPLLYHGADYATPGPVPFDASLLPAGTVTRNLTLNEDFDNYGRLIQLEGTTTQNGLNNQGLPTWGRGYLDNPTERPNAGAVEVWNIYNLTGDTHPIHFHLVNVQIIQRAQFDVGDPTATPPIPPTFAPLSGTERLPDPNEIGWKETVRMNPGEVTTVIMKFDLPKVPFTVNPSTRDNINGNEYVWHCHILEHEEHDMMRPLVVVGPYPLAVVPESATISGSKGGTKTFEIVNGNPGYTITASNPSFPPFPNHVNSSGGKFLVTVKRGTTPKTVTYTITDSAGATVTATLNITQKRVL
jgi:spore coat protein A